MTTIDQFFTQALQAAHLPVTEYTEAYSFGDAADADALAALILAGRKTATSSGFELYGSDPLPTPGGYDVVLAASGAPVAVITTTAVDVMPFLAVPAAIAAAEGEGDLSLAYWRRVHQAFFTKEYRAAGLTFDPTTAKVVVEHFRLVYSRADAVQPD